MNWIVERQKPTILSPAQEKIMRSLSAGALVIAAVFCATPLSLRLSPGNGTPVTLAFDSAAAADLDIPVRHHRHASRYGYYSALYDRYCGGPYVGGGWNGGTYYGGPWIDLRCYNYIY
jgi:hypothetical protein